MSVRDNRVEVGLEMGSIRPNKVLFTEFATCSDSVFEDSYDHNAEADIVAKLILDPANVEHPRVIDFEHRMFLLKSRIKYVTKGRAAISKIMLEDYKITMISKKGNSRIPKMKALVPSDVATITLHTAEAVSILEGVKKTPSKYGYPGLKSAGSAVRDLYFLSIENNPFADLALINFERDLSIVSNMIQGKTTKYTNMLEQEEKRGLNLPILVSAEPMSFPIDFGSQYSVALSRLVLMYDYAIRVILTVTNAGLIRRKSFIEERADIRRNIIRTSQEVCKYRRLVSHPAIRSLRPESLLNDDPANLTLLSQATLAVGELPLDVLIGNKLPNYSSRTAIEANKVALYEAGLNRILNLSKTTQPSELVDEAENE